MTAPVTTAPDGAPVLLQIVGDLKRNRLTTFFRAIMVIPHVVVLYFVNIAVGVVLIISWLAALFTGQVPAGLRDFTIGSLRWQTRVGAYYALLTDEYPPFSFDAGSYPVDIAVPPAGKLNRLAVLFRIVLIIPAYLMALVSGIVLYVLVIVAWFAGVLAGSTPKGVYDTIAGCLQFNVRLGAYYSMVTPTYPSGITGPASITAPAIAA